jgi:hypothetical protein
MVVEAEIGTVLVCSNTASSHHPLFPSATTSLERKVLSECKVYDVSKLSKGVLRLQFTHGDQCKHVLIAIQVSTVGFRFQAQFSS